VGGLGTEPQCETRATHGPSCCTRFPVHSFSHSQKIKPSPLQFKIPKSTASQGQYHIVSDSLSGYPSSGKCVHTHAHTHKQTHTRHTHRHTHTRTHTRTHTPPHTTTHTHNTIPSTTIMLAFKER